MTDETTMSASATELLAQTSKQFLGFVSALEVAKQRLEFAAGAERALEAARGAEQATKTRIATLMQEATEQRAKAQEEAAQLLTVARREVENVRAELALLVAEKNRLTGEITELQVKRTQLAGEVQGLVTARGALTPR